MPDLSLLAALDVGSSPTTTDPASAVDAVSPGAGRGSLELVPLDPDYDAEDMLPLPVKEKTFVATWLDALPVSPDVEPVPSRERIASVNSDDNGLYRMFVGLSP